MGQRTVRDCDRCGDTTGAILGVTLGTGTSLGGKPVVTTIDLCPGCAAGALNAIARYLTPDQSHGVLRFMATGPRWLQHDDLPEPEAAER